MLFNPPIFPPNYLLYLNIYFLLWLSENIQLPPNSSRKPPDLTPQLNTLFIYFCPPLWYLLPESTSGLFHLLAISWPSSLSSTRFYSTCLAFLLLSNGLIETFFYMRVQFHFFYLRQHSWTGRGLSLRPCGWSPTELFFFLIKRGRDPWLVEIWGPSFLHQLFDRFKQRYCFDACPSKTIGG